RGIPARRSRSAPLRSPSGRSCPQGRLSLKGAGGRPASGYADVVTLRPIRSPMDPSVQVLDPPIEVCLVVLPSQPINPRRRVSLESKECCPKHRNTEMVEERGEPLLPSLPCDLSYTFQRLVHAFPVLRPARAMLACVPLGPGPWLHQLRCRSSGVVRRLHCYYGRV